MRGSGLHLIRGHRGARRQALVLAVAIGLACVAALADRRAPARLPDLPAQRPEVSRDAASGAWRTTLTVLTYNIAGLPWPVRLGRETALQQIGDDLRRLRAAGRAPDVLLLQEAFTPTAADVGTRAGYPNRAQGPAADDPSALDGTALPAAFLDARSFWKGERTGKLAASGLFIYSVYPITELHTTPFGARTCAGYDCLANKGVMLARISIPGLPGPVQVFNAHFNSRNGSGVDPGRSLYAHQRQVDEARRFLDRRMRPDLPFVYSGDFNTKGSPERFAYEAAHLPGTEVHVYCQRPDSQCDVRARRDAEAPWLFTNELHGFASGATVSVRPIRIEAMFERQADGSRPSDHDASLVTYELTWPAARSGGLAASP